MSDKPMRDNHDPILTQLFGEQDTALTAEGFVNELVLRLEREQHKRQLHFAIAVCAVLAIVALVGPWIVQFAGSIGALADVAVGSFVAMLHSPITWFVAGALAIGLLPSAYVWWAWRRY